MVRRFSTNFAIFSIVFDALLVVACLWLISLVRPYLQASFIKDINRTPVIPLVLYVLFPLLWVVIMAFFGVYDAQRNLRIVDEFTSLSLASFLAVIAEAGVLYLTYRDVSRALFVLFA